MGQKCGGRESPPHQAKICPPPLPGNIPPPPVDSPHTKVITQ